MGPKIFPILITDERLQHIKAQPGRGHITREELEEAAAHAKIFRSNAKDKPADLIVRGSALNGKKLVLYVKLLSEDSNYSSKLITARPE